MSTVRLQSTATTLKDGRVLVAGAYTSGGVLPVSEIYDPGTGTWSPTASMNVARAAYSAVLLPNGNVLVAGGFNFESGYVADAEVYDPTAGTWTATSPMASIRSGHTGTLLQNGTVLVTGGFDSASYVSSTETYDRRPERGRG
jgi:N-acetylneuraminic acid mutarotase